MGVAIKSVDNIGQTSQLVDWITKVRCKKSCAKRQRRKNLLVEAVLTNALFRAEMELRHKQQQRLQRWQQMKNNWCLNYNDDDISKNSVWNTKTCEELNSLDTFMSQLKTVKVPLER